MRARVSSKKDMLPLQKNGEIEKILIAFFGVKQSSGRVRLSSETPSDGAMIRHWNPIRSN